VREAVEEAGLTEVPQLEERLNLLATIAQIAPLLGLLGTILGFIRIFMQLQEDGLYAHISGENSLATGIWQALICAAAGIAVAIPAHAGYNYLVSRINKIVLDMERAAGEIVNIVTENGNGRNRHEISAQRQNCCAARLRWRRSRPSFFLLVIFLMLGALLPTPGIALQLQPADGDLPGTDQPTVAVAVDSGGRFYFANQIVSEAQLTSICATR
jgi:hypothetical protein